MNAAFFALTTLGVGWVALLPLRDRLGTFGYHVAAYPIGLLAWVGVAGAARAMGSPWTGSVTLIGLSVAAIGFAILGRAASGNGDRSQVAVAGWTYAAWAGAIAALAWVVEAVGATAGTYDSTFHYATWGLWLFDGNGLDRWITSAYGPLLPAVHAGGMVFDIDWMATPYPVMAAHVATLVGAGVAGTGAVLSRTLRARTVRIVTMVTVTLLVTTAPFAGHILYVHSHMFSACYLLLAIFALRRGFGGSRDTVEPAWLWVGGLATAGLAFARVDGLAYAVIPLVLAAVIRIDRRLPGKTIFPALIGAGVPLAGYYGWAFSSLGDWQSADKLTGRGAATVLAALIVLALVAVAVERLPLVGRLIERTGAGWWALAAAVSGVAAVAVLKWDTFSTAVTTMWRNMTLTGGFGLLWPILTGIIVLSLVSWRLWARNEWPARLLLGAALFAAVAVIVHGVGHPGRLGAADSFSRVAFHVVPLLFWYGGLFAKGIFAKRTAPR